MNVTDLLAIPNSVWTVSGGIIVALIALSGTYLRWRSGVIFVNPSVIKDLQDQVFNLSDKFDEEQKKRREAEVEISASNRRIDSLEHNEQMNQRRMQDLEKKLVEWHEGILILIAQIERHDSSPEWRPKDE